MRLHLHWHRLVADERVHVYSECRCGSRKVSTRPGGYSPIRRGWLAGGPWHEPEPRLPPRGPGAASPAPRLRWGGARDFAARVGQVEPHVSVRAPLPPDPPMTPEQARRVLRSRHDFMSWIEHELISHHRQGSREQRRFAERLDQERLAAEEENRRLEELEQLPDADLQLLLDSGWDPAKA